jgi:hypothetical protein
LFFKCENFQKIGAFKARGAFHAIARLVEEMGIEEVRRRGVVTHSSGTFFIISFPLVVWCVLSWLSCWFLSSWGLWSHRFRRFFLAGFHVSRHFKLATTFLCRKTGSE